MVIQQFELAALPVVGLIRERQRRSSTAVRVADYMASSLGKHVEGSMIRRYLALTILAAVVSCGALEPEEQSLRLETNQSRYDSGAVVQVTISNVSSRSQSYGACTQIIERRLRSRWAVHPASPGQVPCLDVLLLLDPGASAVVLLQLPSAIEPGEYRWRLPESGNAETNAFEVSAPASSRSCRRSPSNLYMWLAASRSFTHHLAWLRRRSSTAARQAAT